MLYRHCVVSALCGCLAAMAAKYAFDASQTMFVLDLSCRLLGLPVAECVTPAMSWIIRIPFILLMLGFNGVMLTTLVKSLHEYGTVTATAVINAVSFTLSGVLGFTFFGEKIGILWMIGILWIIAGLYLLAPESDAAKSDKRKRE